MIAPRLEDTFATVITYEIRKAATGNRSTGVGARPEAELDTMASVHLDGSPVCESRNIATCAGPRRFLSDNETPHALREAIWRFGLIADLGGGRG